MLPEHMRDSMERYIQHGVEPGGFMFSILENDFVHAYQRADQTNKRALANYALFLFEYAPSECWGNRPRVQKWIAGGGINGTYGQKTTE